MGRFTRRLRGLQSLFPSSDAVATQPSELSEHVNLVHPWPGRGIGLENVRLSELLSAPSVTPSRAFNPATDFGANVQAGEWIEIIAGDVSHDSVTARVVQLFLRSPNNINVIVARWTGFLSGLTNGQASGFEPLFGQRQMEPAVAVSSDVHLPPWPLIVPPGWSLLFQGDTAGAVWTITVNLVFAVHALVESPIALG